MPTGTRHLTGCNVPPVENHLIESLPRKDRQGLVKACDHVELRLSDVLFEAATPMRHVYFPLDGFVSLVRPVDAHEGVEVGMVGREGMLGAQLALGVAVSPLRGLVQGPGTARRVDVTTFLSLLALSPPLQRVMHRYLYVLMEQLATSAACQRYHPIGPRLARWLLMSRDRAHTDSFYVTQQFLALMLGVRRVGVTAAASALQRDSLIEYRRGRMTVLDRPGLEEAACSCYRTDRKSYAALL